MNSYSSPLEIIIDNNYAKVCLIRDAVAETYRPNIVAETLNNVNLVPRKLRFGNKTVMTPRNIGSFSDPGVTYDYSGYVEENSTEWTPWIDLLRQHVEQYSQYLGFGPTKYNYVLINQYRDGKDSIGWHSDDERRLVRGPPIASISLGATRDFKLRPKKEWQDLLGKEAITIQLRDGDLLFMGGMCQTYYAHTVPRRMKVKEPRLNYTFRSIVE